MQSNVAQQLDRRPQKRVDGRFNRASVVDPAIAAIREGGFKIDSEGQIGEQLTFALSDWCRWCANRGIVAVDATAQQILEYQLAGQTGDLGDREILYRAIGLAAALTGRPSPVPPRQQGGNGFADLGHGFEEGERIRLGLPSPAEARAQAFEAENARLKASVADLERENARLQAQVAELETQTESEAAA